jgi:hypothetical protein
LHWRSYGDHPLPSGPEALDEPLAAFPSWYLRIVCDRCGKERMVNEVHMPQRDLPISDILARARHDGCGGRAGKAELLTGIAAASSRPVRRIGVVLGVGGVLVWVLVSVHGRGGDLDRHAVRRGGVGGGGHRTVGLRWSCKTSTMAERGIR